MNHRVFKFRIWDTHKNKFRDLSVAWNEYTNENYGIDGEDGHYPVSEGYVIQQFTGILDKKGKEIYEGDIVNIRGNKVVVEWFSENAGWGTSGGVMFAEFKDKIEVIGNIFLNKDLIN